MAYLVCFFFIFLIEAELIYSIMLVSAVQPSVSAINIYFFKLYSIID